MLRRISRVFVVASFALLLSGAANQASASPILIDLASPLDFLTASFTPMFTASLNPTVTATGYRLMYAEALADIALHDDSLVGDDWAFAITAPTGHIEAFAARDGFTTGLPALIMTQLGSRTGGRSR